MIRCINSNIEIYSENNYNSNNWSLINNNGTFNIRSDALNTINFCILENGNIGIGNTSPNSKLDIKGSINIDGPAILNSNIIINNTQQLTPIAQFGNNANAQSNIYLIEYLFFYELE